MTGNNSNLELVNINAYTKFGKILSIIFCSLEIDWKRKSTIKGHNFLVNLQKIMHNNPNLYFHKTLWGATVTVNE